MEQKKKISNNEEIKNRGQPSVQNPFIHTHTEKSTYMLSDGYGLITAQPTHTHTLHSVASAADRHTAPFKEEKNYYN